MPSIILVCRGLSSLRLSAANCHRFVRTARPPISSEAMHALNEIGAAYSNLEYDLAKGERGGRGFYVESALALLCEAEGATVVNNCAAALLLIVQHFTRKAGRARPPGRSEIVISRGELVQIGGGFRISEILEASGAKL